MVAPGWVVREANTYACISNRLPGYFSMSIFLTDVNEPACSR